MSDTKNTPVHPDYHYVQYALNKPGSYEDYPFGIEHLVLKVGTKMFGIVGIKKDHIQLSLKCDPLVSQALRLKYSAIQPGYHLNKKHWNTLTIDGSVPEDEIHWMIDHSYELVHKSLTKAEKQRLAILYPE